MAFLIPGFQQQTVAIESEDGKIEIDCQYGGQGPALLLLHGFPQSKAIWHRVAPELQKHFFVVAADLRGYGASSKPHGKTDHSTYSKKAMAKDQLMVMKNFGHESFFLIGHDRGGRVAHRLAADYPENVKRLMVLDVSPTLTMNEKTNMEFAKGYWHWFFLIQPEPIPEKLIGADPEFWIKNHMGGRYAGLSIFDPACWSEYLSGVQDPKTLHAMCEDYRASASIDLEHDRADLAAKKRIPMPIRVLWGEHGLVNKCFKPLDDWSLVATEVSGQSLDCGHYIPEERPQELVEQALNFFK